MDTKTYQKLAVLTNGTKGHTNNIVHAALGMASEAAELIEHILNMGTDSRFVQGVLEECGDAFWFTSLLVTEMGWDLEPFIDNRPTHVFTPLGHAHAMIYSAGVICDLVKKEFAYGKTFDTEKMNNAICGYVENTIAILERIGYTPAQCFAGNIAKLEKRYPGLQFDADACSNRDKAGELKAMGDAASAR